MLVGALLPCARYIRYVIGCQNYPPPIRFLLPQGAYPNRIDATPIFKEAKLDALVKSFQIKLANIIDISQ
ncbi:MAG: hypothetical protein DSM106950_16830 [Stigonema ocellatum SAG 48.90 = DSM 106950]|nr:hypothetical protein [Stigonema ocellatum SAG 48.90 = DSM 106950]